MAGSSSAARGRVITTRSLWRRAGVATMLGVLLLLGSFRATEGSASGKAAPWKLVWADEFTGRAGTLPAQTRWTADVGGQGWGNQESEYYTDRPQNAHLDGQGHLAIVARRETVADSSCWYGTCLYSSARLKTQGLFAFRYGRVEARIKIPHGVGYWPAFWMLGDNIDRVGWPACGEIDIMENVGQEPSTVHGSAYGPGDSGALTDSFVLSGRPLSASFHTFAVEWEPKALRWYIDGLLYETRTPADLGPGETWVYDHPFFLLLNLAIGGQWPGDPAASTVFPQAMLVDYVRVYQHQVTARRY